MAVYNPVITTLASPAVQVTSANMTYEEVVNSLGYYIFKVNSFFFQGESFTQLLQPYSFDSYDSNGKQFVRIINEDVDPYQDQFSIFIDALDNDIILNGRTIMSFPILALQSLIIRVYATKDYIAHFLMAKNFDKVITG